ncbi:aspartic peptidase domain-containing protein [Lyophyllum atratum]|nr:aspartic peptidase domain-containing protein [Lyophyllum atratum]
MKHLHLFSLGLVLSLQSQLVTSLKIPFKRTAHPKTLIGTSSHSIGTLLAGTSDDDNLGNVGNIRYTTNITINGKEVHVALDTGSTDLWVIPPGGIGQFNDTEIPLSLRYGDGSYGVKGTIGVSPFEFGPYKIGKQAFLNANESTIGAMTDLGIYGLFGLGFDHPETSPINSAIEKKYGPSATWGASVLQNIFNQNASKPNFIAVDLARTEDLEGTAGGSFNIADYDKEYVAVADAPKLLQFPRNATRWTTLLEDVWVDGVSIKFGSTIEGVPAGKAIALVDTGSPAGVFPAEIMQGIFSRIEGAAYDKTMRLWLIPCNSTTNVDMVMGNQSFSIHPLDLSEVTFAMISGQNHTLCTSSFSTHDKVGGNEFDLVLGDTFLRNVYSVYDFGDPSGSSDGAMGVPYMQFLSQIDAAKAAEQAIAVRNKAIAEIGPEIPPKELLAILNGPATTTSGASTLTSTTKTSVNLAPGETFAADTSDVSRYATIVIGLLAANVRIYTVV